MSRSPARFTQSEIARAIRAIAQSGEDMAVEIGRDGAIRIVKAPPEAPRVDEKRRIAL